MPFSILYTVSSVLNCVVKGIEDKRCNGKSPSPQEGSGREGLNQTGGPRNVSRGPYAAYWKAFLFWNSLSTLNFVGCYGFVTWLTMQMKWHEENILFLNIKQFLQTVDWYWTIVWWISGFTIMEHIFLLCVVCFFQNRSTFNVFNCVNSVAHILKDIVFYCYTIITEDVPNRCPKDKCIQIIDLMAIML